MEIHRVLCEVVTVSYRLLLNVLKLKTVTRLSLLFVGLSSCSSGLNSRPFCVMFIVDTVALRQVFFPEYIIFPSKVSLHLCSTLISILILLVSEGQAGQTWGTFEQSNKFSDISDFTSQNNTSHQKELIVISYFSLCLVLSFIAILAPLSSFILSPFSCISFNIVVSPTRYRTLFSMDVVAVCESEVTASGCIH